MAQSTVSLRIVPLFAYRETSKVGVMVALPLDVMVSKRKSESRDRAYMFFTATLLAWGDRLKARANRGPWTSEL
jgi:hypothetical protein